MARVKYPIRAALARFPRMRDHLADVESFIFQADQKEYYETFYDQITAIRNGLMCLEHDLEPLREKQK